MSIFESIAPFQFVYLAYGICDFLFHTWHQSNEIEMIFSVFQMKNASA